MRPLRNRLLTFSLADDIANAASSKVYVVRKVIIHPQFVVHANGGEPLHDVAVAHLEEPVRDVHVARLASLREANHLVAGSRVEIVGYGRTSRTSDIRGRKHVGRSKIAQKWKFEWRIGFPTMAQNCDGDSGGPAFADISGKKVLIGIVSRSGDNGDSCDAGTIYARVDTEAKWISSAVEDTGTVR